jgi:plastocyanin
MPLKRIAIVVFIAGGMLVTRPRPGLAGGEVGVAQASVGRGSGTVEGTIFYRHDRKHAWRLSRYYVKSPKIGELAEAVISLSGPSISRSSAGRQPSTVTVDQREMRFVPETVAIRAGDRVRFTNSDSQTHNITVSDPRLQFSDTIANGQSSFEAFSRASGIHRPFALGCKFHCQMQGWVYVFDHAFFKTTGVDGRFRLDSIPPGDYRLDVAQSAGELHASRVVQVKPNQTVKLEIILTPTDRSTAE